MMGKIADVGGCASTTNLPTAPEDPIHRQGLTRGKHASGSDPAHVRRRLVMRPFVVTDSLAPWLLSALAACVLATFIGGPEDGIALAVVVTVVGLTRGLCQAPQ